MTYAESRRSLRLLCLLILLLGALPGFAQYSGNLQGVVSDPAGAAVNGASVVLRNLDTGVTATITTSNSGNYRFSSLPPGNYAVAAEASGFRKAQANFALNTSETKGINLALPLASTQQSITVEEHPPLVDTDDSRLQVQSSTYEVAGLDQVAHVDVAGAFDHGDGKLCLFILNRDLSRSHDVEVVWEDAAPSRLIAASVLTGEDLKAANSFAAPRRAVPQSLAVPESGGARTKFEVPAHSYTAIQWSL